MGLYKLWTFFQTRLKLRFANPERFLCVSIHYLKYVTPKNDRMSIMNQGNEHYWGKFKIGDIKHACNFKRNY